VDCPCEADDLIGDLLVHLSKANNWFDMYKVIECLERGFGGEQEFIKLGWAPPQQLKRLKRTANSFRHMRGKNPPFPMTLLEARTLLVFLVRRALDTIDATRD
jgi:hypothetical protein